MRRSGHQRAQALALDPPPTGPSRSAIEHERPGAERARTRRGRSRSAATAAPARGAPRAAPCTCAVGGDVETAGRVDGDQHPRRLRQRAADHDSLLVAAREACDHLLDARGPTRYSSHEPCREGTRGAHIEEPATRVAREQRRRERGVLPDGAGWAPSPSRWRSPGMSPTPARCAAATSTGTQQRAGDAHSARDAARVRRARRRALPGRCRRRRRCRRSLQRRPRRSSARARAVPARGRRQRLDGERSRGCQRSGGRQRDRGCKRGRACRSRGHHRPVAAARAGEPRHRPSAGPARRRRGRAAAVVATSRPPRITLTRSQSASASSSLWVMKSTSMPPARRRARTREQLVDLGRRQHRRRLVEEQHARCRRPAPRRISMRARTPTGSVAHGSTRDRRSSSPWRAASAARFRREPGGRHSHAAERFGTPEREVLGDRQRADEREVLVHHPDAARRGRRAATGDERASVDADRAAVGRDAPEIGAHERRLAGAVLAEDAVDARRREARASSGASAVTAPKRLWTASSARRGGATPVAGRCALPSPASRVRVTIVCPESERRVGTASVPFADRLRTASTSARTAGADDRFERRIVDHGDRAVLHGLLDHARAEAPVLHLARDLQEGRRDVDHRAREHRRRVIPRAGHVAPKAKMPRSAAAWNTPGPAASALWSTKRQPRSMSAERCGARRADVVPVADVGERHRIVGAGMRRARPGRRGACCFTDGISMPPTAQALPSGAMRAARSPRTKVASSSRKTIGATFGRTVLPEVVMKTVPGNSGATRAAASWNSKPWPMTSWKPRRA